MENFYLLYELIVLLTMISIRNHGKHHDQFWLNMAD